MLHGLHISVNNNKKNQFGQVALINAIRNESEWNF